MRKKSKEKALVIKFGGSQATNEHGVQEAAITEWFRQLDLDLMSLFSRAAFVIGGGQRVRLVQNALGKNATNEQKDASALQVLHSHAKQIQGVVQKEGYSVVPVVPRSVAEAQSVLQKQREFAVALGGLAVGQSTDTVAVTAAEIWQDAGYEAWIVILSNIWNIFTNDPNKDKTARPIAKSSIDTLVQEGVLLNNPHAFKPGMNVPLDPVAVSYLERRQAAGQGMAVWLGHMDDVKTVNSFLQGKKISRGTYLAPRTSPTRFLKSR